MIEKIALAATLAASAIAPHAAAAPASEHRANNVVLVHSALVDGSSWRGVFDILKRDGFNVSIVAHTQLDLDDDVRATQRIIDRQPGPTVLVGASYGGTIITEAGAHPKVSALVYVAAMQPEVGDTLAGLSQGMPPASDSLVPDPHGFLSIAPERFHAEFGADIPAADAEYLSHAQMPLALKAATTPTRVASWHQKPSYGIVARQDRLISPDLQRFMYQRSHAHITEVDASHAVFITQPAAVAEVIRRAAQGGGR